MFQFYALLQFHVNEIDSVFRFIGGMHFFTFNLTSFKISVFLPIKLRKLIFQDSSQNFIDSFSLITNGEREPPKSTYVRVQRICLLFLIRQIRPTLQSCCSTSVKVNLAAGKHGESFTALQLLYIQCNPCHD